MLQLVFFFFQHASYEPPDEDEENELDYYSDGEYALYSALQKLQVQAIGAMIPGIVWGGGASVCLVDSI